MGIKDFLFGSKPKIDVKDLSTLTPEQQKILKQILGQFGAQGGADFQPEGFGGDLSAGLGDLEQTSLAALEQSALSSADPNNVLNQAGEALKGIFSGGQSDVTDFFNTNIRDPALQSFEETVLPGISRDFGGANFFSSERQDADDRARRDLTTGLSSARADVNLRSRESNLDRILQGIGLAPGLESAGTDSLLKFLEAGGVERGVRQDALDREFGEFGRVQDEKFKRLQAILAALGLQGKENVVTALPGSSGFITDIIAAAAGADRSTTNITGGG